MEIATSQSLSRIWRLALIGTFTAFAWIVLSLLAGFGSGNAQADDADDDGLLGAVTSVVDATTSEVTETVSTVTETVTETVDTVVTVAPSPVQEPVREVVKAVATVVAQAAKPAADTVSGGVVGSVATPVVEVVTQVPIVGEVVAQTGVDDAVTDLGETIDRTLGEVAEAATDAGTDLGLPPAGPLPGTPGVPGLPGLPSAPEIPVGGHPLPALDVAPPTASDGAGGVDAAAVGAASAHSAFLAAHEPRSAAAGGSMTSSAASVDARGPFAPAGGLCPPSALSSGPGGSGPGAWALVALGPLVALRAWVRRVGPEDEHAPPAPAAPTDVSPD